MLIDNSASDKKMTFRCGDVLFMLYVNKTLTVSTGCFCDCRNVSFLPLEMSLQSHLMSNKSREETPQSQAFHGFLSLLYLPSVKVTGTPLEER